MARLTPKQIVQRAEQRLKEMNPAPKRPKKPLIRKRKGTKPGQGAKPSKELSKKVGQANRMLNQARKRIKAKKPFYKSMSKSVQFMDKVLHKIYGKKVKTFSTKDVTEAQLQQIESAIDEMLKSPTMTVKGQKEIRDRSLVGFYRKPLDEITNKERRIFDTLVDNGVLDKVKEIAFVHTSILNAALLIAQDMSADKTAQAITDWVNNKDNAREGAGTDTATGNFYDYIHARYIEQAEAGQNGGYAKQK